MLQATAQAHRAQQRLVAATLAATRRSWSQLGEDFDAGWRKVGPRLLVLTTAAQVGAARNGAAYVPAALDEQRADVAADGKTNPKAFAGYASDGRPLESLLYGAVIHAKQADADSLVERLAAGRDWLDMAVHTQVSDAFRQAESVSVAARPRVEHIRMVNAPCCQRCAVLAGRIYRWSTGFERHPGCDCSMIPTTVANPNPPGVTIGPDDVKDLTIAQRKAISDGADMNQVINSHRGNSRSKNGMTTTAGSKALRKRPGGRLTPEGIYKIASDRPEALKLLKQHGYLI